MLTKIRMAILEDHQGIIDCYMDQLNTAADIEVVATGFYGEELATLLAKNRVDVLLFDVQLPTSRRDPNPYPILYLIPKLLQLYPDLSVLVVSMQAQGTLVNAAMEAGVSGYVLKDDRASIHGLATVIRTVARGGVHMSPYAFEQMLKCHTGRMNQPLSQEQLKALSLIADHPDASYADLASMLQIANSTARSLLFGSYIKLKTNLPDAAVAKARQMGLIPPAKGWRMCNCF